MEQYQELDRRTQATRFESGDDVALHESNLISVERARALAAATQAATTSPESSSAPETVPVMNEFELVGRFGKNILDLRTAALGRAEQE